MQEGLRLYPPGVFAVREAVEDMELCGHAIPRGSWVHVRRPAAPRRRACALFQNA
jgi:cytochrome P450